MVDEEYFAGAVDFHLPATRQIVVGIGEHVHEMYQISIVLISVKTTRITTNLVNLTKITLVIKLGVQPLKRNKPHPCIQSLILAP